MRLIKENCRSLNTIRIGETSEICPLHHKTFIKIIQASNNPDLTCKWEENKIGIDEKEWAIRMADLNTKLIELGLIVINDKKFVDIEKIKMD
jgi:hypothetical protein